MKKLIKILLTVLILFSVVGCNDGKDHEISRIIKQMSLEQKVAQLIIPSFRYDYYVSDDHYTYMTTLNPYVEKLVKEYGFGGIILFAGNIDDTYQTIDLINSLQLANKEGGHPALLMGVDEEGGNISRVLFDTRMPGNLALGASGQEENAYDAFKITGEELSLLGFNCDFAPVADVFSNPTNPVINLRSFSSDPEMCGKMVTKAIEALHENGIMSCVKHFPGHGASDTDSHKGLPVIDKTLEQLEQEELIPFSAAIEADTDLVMMGHMFFPQIDSGTYTGKDGKTSGIPSSLSKVFITDLLREKLGYDGIVISDSLTMGAIVENIAIEDVVKMSLNAGMDFLLMPCDDKKPLLIYINEVKTLIGKIVEMIENEEISKDRIDESLYRILSLKKKYGLLEEYQPNENKEEAMKTIGSYDHHLKELEITKKGVTVVKNEDVLPLAGDKKTIIFIPYGSQVNTVDFALDILADKNLADKGKVTLYGYDSDDRKSFSKNIEPLLKDADQAVVISAMYDYEELSDEMFEVADLILKTCAKKDIKSVLLSAHLPFDLVRYEADGKLAVYYAGGMRVVPQDYDKDNLSYGPNLVAGMLIIFGDGKPEGKLPVDIHELVKENGLYQPGEELVYPAGTGLSIE